MQTLDLELLRTFVRLASSNTFAKAGQQLGRSQSAITQQMQRLEQKVGHPLFQKNGRTKQLTEQGQRLLRYAQDMLALNDDALRAMSTLDEGELMRIGSPHDIADSLLAQLLTQIQRFMPRIRLDIAIDRSPRLIEALHRGELDMTLSTREDRQLKSFIVRKLPTLWLCASHFVYPAQQPLPLVLGDEPSIFRRFAIEALESQRIPWRLAHTASSPVGVKSAVRAGLGITARSIELLGSDVRILGPNEGLPTLPEISYHLCMRPGNINPLASQIFDQLKKNFANPQSIS